MLREEFRDLLELVFGESEGCGWEHAVDLLGAATTDDGRGNGGVVKRPGDGDDAVLDTVFLADGAEQVNEFQVAKDQGLLKLFLIAAEVILRHFLDAFLSHGAGQQAGLHGRIIDDADTVLCAEGKNVGFDGAVDHGIGRLERGDGRDLEGALHLGDAEVGDADEPDFAFALEFSHGRPALFDFGVGNGPVNLVKVDDVRSEASEACFYFFANFHKRLNDLAVGAPRHGALGEEKGLVRDGFESGTDDLFGMA